MSSYPQPSLRPLGLLLLLALAALSSTAIPEPGSIDVSSVWSSPRLKQDLATLKYNRHDYGWSPGQTCHSSPVRPPLTHPLLGPGVPRRPDENSTAASAKMPPYEDELAVGEGGEEAEGVLCTWMGVRGWDAAWVGVLLVDPDGETVYAGPRTNVINVHKQTYRNESVICFFTGMLHVVTQPYSLAGARD